MQFTVGVIVTAFALWFFTDHPSGECYKTGFVDYYHTTEVTICGMSYEDLLKLKIVEKN